MTRAASRTLLLVLLPFLLPEGASRAATNSCTPALLTTAAVVAANASFEAAILASNTDELARILHPDYLFITSTGEIRDRQEVLRSYGAKEVRLTKFTSESIRVRIYDPVAILTADVEKAGDYTAGPRKGSVFTGLYRFSRVYLCGEDGWQLVSTHENRLPERAAE